MGMAQVEVQRTEGAFRYRSKGSIGYIVPPRCNETVIEEALRIRPAGVTWCFASLGLSELERGDFQVALRAVETAAQELAQRRVSAVAYSGIPLTTAQGPRYHEELQRRIQAAVGDIPVETDSSLVVRALRTLGVRRVSLITPYHTAIVDALTAMMRGQGFEVADARGMELRLAQLITDTDGEMAYRMACDSAAAQPEIDGFYLSCPQWPIVDSIERIEQATGRPVVTQLQAIVWWAAGVLGLPEPVPGFGRLLRDRPSPAA
jgi:maleate cis-trans isomerase